MQPDLTPLLKASEMIGRIIKKGDVVIYESTVYPGATEEDLIPVILLFNSVNKNNSLGFNMRIHPGGSKSQYHM